MNEQSYKIAKALINKLYELVEEMDSDNDQMIKEDVQTITCGLSIFYIDAVGCLFKLIENHPDVDDLCDALKKDIKRIINS